MASIYYLFILLSKVGTKLKSTGIVRFNPSLRNTQNAGPVTLELLGSFRCTRCFFLRL